jgi:hypothetical protein
MTGMTSLSELFSAVTSGCLRQKGIHRNTGLRKTVGGDTHRGEIHAGQAQGLPLQIQGAANTAIHQHIRHSHHLIFTIMIQTNDPFFPKHLLPVAYYPILLL